MASSSPLLLRTPQLSTNPPTHSFSEEAKRGQERFQVDDEVVLESKSEVKRDQERPREAKKKVENPPTKEAILMNSRNAGTARDVPWDVSNVQNS